MKRFFITAYVTFLVTGFLLWFVLTITHFSYAYLGGLISALAGVLYFIGIYTFDRSSNNMNKTKVYSGLNYAGLLIVLFSLYTWPVPEHYFALFYAALHLVMWEKYLSWYSVFDERKLQFEIDKKLQVDRGVNSMSDIPVKEFLKEPVVWFFYRGNWCPFCVAQLEESVAEIDAFDELGYKLNFVSNQPAERMQSLAKNLNSSVRFLHDENANFVKSLGLLDRRGLPFGLELFGYKSDIVYPAIIVTDSDSVVRYYEVTENDRDRPEVSTLLTELKNLNLN